MTPSERLLDVFLTPSEHFEDAFVALSQRRARQPSMSMPTKPRCRTEVRRYESQEPPADLVAPDSLWIGAWRFINNSSPSGMVVSTSTIFSDANPSP